MSETPDKSPTTHSPAEQGRAPLFRAQALAHKRRSLYGEVILVANPSLWLLSAALLLATAAILGFVFLAPVFGAPDAQNTNMIEGGGQTFWQWLNNALPFEGAP